MSIFNIFPSWGYALLITGLLVALGAQRVQLSDIKTTLAQERADRATEKAKQEQVAREATEKARHIEKLRSAQAQKISSDFSKESNSTKAAFVSSSADANSLRHDIELYTRGGGSSSHTSVARRTDERAIVLGRLLGACQAEAGADSAELEELASQVRGLKRSYESVAAEQ